MQFKPELAEKILRREKTQTRRPVRGVECGISVQGVPGATDSKMYAALGNSMTVQVMAWIGKRIDKVDGLLKKIEEEKRAQQPNGANASATK